MERKPQALHLDRHGRIHSSQTRPLPSDLGTDHAWLSRTVQLNKETQISSYFSATTLAFLASYSPAHTSDEFLFEIHPLGQDRVSRGVRVFVVSIDLAGCGKTMSAR